MKTLWLQLSAALLFAINTFAQHQPPAANKSTAAFGSRLIAIANYTSDGTVYSLQDSAAYLYSGSRGGDMESIINCDYGYTFRTSYVPGIPGYTTRLTNTFNADNNMISSLMQYQWAASSPWENGSRVTNTYDAMNNIADMVYELWDSTYATWYYESKNVYAYTADNKIASNITQHWDGTTLAWVNDWRLSYTYNGYGNPAARLWQMWDSTGVFVDISRVNYTYNAANLLQTEIEQSAIGSPSTWTNFMQTAYAYDASGNKTEEVSSLWNTSTNAWDDDTKTSYSSFVGGKPQFSVFQYYIPATGTFDNNLRHIYTYNSHSQVTSDFVQSWDGSAWTVSWGAAYHKYYYEDYTTGINNAVPAGADLTIYPVPASDAIRVTNNTSQTMHIAITDALGKCVTELNLSAKTTNSIDVSSFADGIYYVKGVGDDGVVVCKTISVQQ